MKCEKKDRVYLALLVALIFVDVAAKVTLGVLASIDTKD